MVQRLETEKAGVEQQLEAAQKKLEAVSYEIDDLKLSNERLAEEHAATKEKLTLAEVIAKQTGGVHPSEGFLEKAQEIWCELGVNPSHRESIRLQIESCLEDTCARKLEEESALKEETSSNIKKLKSELSSMEAALGFATEYDDTVSSMKLLRRLDWLKQKYEGIKPTFDSAVERRGEISKDAEDLASSMKLSLEGLPAELYSLIQNKDQTLSGGDAFDLSDAFLSKCEEEVSSLRLKKARVLVRNTEVRSEVYKLVQEMNLGEDDVLNLSLHSIRQRRRKLPDWWDHEIAAGVARCVVLSTGLVNATQAFSKHLEMVFESLESVANGRRKLSTVLRDIVMRAQKTLLDTVEGEIDVSDAYASFHDALFRLPPLSKEFVDACISEIETLISGVEAMAQSEIEALTVVWEALNVSISTRGKFWSEIEDSTKTIESSARSPFDEVLQASALDKEQWVLATVKNSLSSYKKLETRLFRLERIHQEVEKRRSSQDSKSKIISLDSELRILSARLSDFEDKKCNKQRLLTKKSGSAALLKEERFRKQMQGKYTSTLEQLVRLLKKWKEEEGAGFDPNLLSDEVRALVKASQGASSWVEKRTEFMHLRMTKSAIKRKPEQQTTRLTPPRKRHIKPYNVPRPDTGDGTLRKKREARMGASPGRSRPLEPTSAFKKQKTEKQDPQFTDTRKTSPTGKSSSGLNVKDTAAKKESTTPKRRLLGSSKRESTTLMPFGKVLSGTPLSTEKENSKT